MLYDRQRKEEEQGDFHEKSFFGEQKKKKAAHTGDLPLSYQRKCIQPATGTAEKAGTGGEKTGAGGTPGERMAAGANGLYAGAPAGKAKNAQTQ